MARPKPKPPLICGLPNCPACEEDEDTYQKAMTAWETETAVEAAEARRKVAKVNKNSWWFRWYCWVWDADPKRADFCKLFWGLLLSPFGFIFFGFLLLIFHLSWPFRKVAELIKAWADSMNEKERLLASQPPHPDQVEAEEQKMEKRKARRRKRQEFLAWWAQQADRVVAFVKSISRFLAFLFTPAFWIIDGFERAVISVEGRWPWTHYVPHVLGCTAWATLIIYFGYKLVLITPMLILYALGTLIALTAVIILIARSDTAMAGVAVTFEMVAVKPTLTLKEALSIGYHAVKDRTCPIIEVTDE